MTPYLQQFTLNTLQEATTARASHGTDDPAHLIDVLSLS